MPAEDPETAAARIVELVKTRIPQRFGFDAMQDIQVLCPMNRGGAGARSLNIELQAALNPAGERKVERFGWTFAPGDKVMQIENDYDKEVYNGDIGLVADVDPEAGELTARFEGRDLRLRLRRAGHACAGLCRDGPQEPGLGVSGGGDPGADAALRDVAAEPALHRGHARQAAWWCWWVRRRRWPSRCATLRDAGAGRSWTNGWPVRWAVQNRAYPPVPTHSRDRR